MRNPKLNNREAVSGAGRAKPLIKKVIFRNFRGILKGEVKLGPLTIIIGPNNSGKTTILEALLLTHGFREIAGVRVSSILSSLHETLGSSGLLHLIHNYGVKLDRAVVGYEVGGDLHALVILADNRIRFYFLRKVGSLDKLLGLSATELGEFKRIAAVERFSIRGEYLVEGLVGDALFVRYELLRDYMKYVYRDWHAIANSGVASKAAEWVSRCLGEDFIDVLAEPFGGRPSLQLYRADRTRVRLGDLGDGARALLIAKILLEHLRPNLFLWDDVEAHMNPKALSMLASMIADFIEGGGQAVVTTHSLEAALILSEVVGEGVIVRAGLVKGELHTEYYGAEEVEKLKKLGVDVRV